MFTLYIFPVADRPTGWVLLQPIPQKRLRSIYSGRYPNYELSTRSRLAPGYNNESVWVIPSTVHADD